MINYKSKIGHGKEEKVVIGIDVAKHKHVAVALFPDGSFSKPLRFRNNRQGFNSLKDFISKGVKVYRKPALIALEPTGHYGQLLIDFINSLKLSLCIIQARQTARTKEIFDNSPLKNDDKDAAQIAWLAANGCGLCLVNREGPYRKLALLSSRRVSLVEDATRLKNRICRVVDLLFPEFEGLFSDILCKTGRMLLRKAPTPEVILKKRVSTILRLVSKASRGRFKEPFVNMLYQLALVSIGLKKGTEILVQELNELLDDLENIEARKSRLEEQLSLILKSCPETPFLLSIPGIGQISVALILAETGSLKEYARASSLLKQAGLNLFEISSGLHRGQRRISRRGRSQLRRVLYFAALRMVTKKGAFRKYYLRLTEQNGVLKMKALVAVSSKLLRICFALTRDKNYFQLNYKPERFKRAA